MNHKLLSMVAILFAAFLAPLSAIAAVKEVQFYSEGVLCQGKLFLPENYSATAKMPAVVLAPGSQQLAASLEKFAAELSARGLVAMTFDYRGWGKSGGFLYFGEPVRWDDRLRFSQTTSKMVIRRKRLEPKLQLIDIRNAITFLQGEAGVDRARIGVWGTGLSGGHAIAVAGSDARVKVVVAHAPLLEKTGAADNQRKAFAPTAEQRSAMIKLARTGAAPTSAQAASTMNAAESKLAFAEYHPFWYVDQIPQTTAVRFVLDFGNAAETEANAVAASKVLKGATDVVKLSSADAGTNAAAEWFVKNL